MINSLLDRMDTTAQSHPTNLAGALRHRALAARIPFATEIQNAQRNRGRARTCWLRASDSALWHFIVACSGTGGRHGTEYAVSMGSTGHIHEMFLIVRHIDHVVAW